MPSIKASGGIFTSSKPFFEQDKYPLFGRKIDGNVDLDYAANLNNERLGSNAVKARNVDSPVLIVTAISGTTLTVGDTGGFAGSINDFKAGDRCLIHNSQGTAAANGNVGTWELVELAQDGSASTIEIKNPLTKIYGTSGDNSDLTGQKIQLIRVPEYDHLILRDGGTIRNHGWNGTWGGICAFSAEYVECASLGYIDMGGRGFRGGAGGTPGARGQQGEGYAGVGSTSGPSNFGGGGGGANGANGANGNNAPAPSARNGTNAPSPQHIAWGGGGGGGGGGAGASGAGGGSGAGGAYGDVSDTGLAGQNGNPGLAGGGGGNGGPAVAINALPAPLAQRTGTGGTGSPGGAATPTPVGGAAGLASPAIGPNFLDKIFMGGGGGGGGRSGNGGTGGNGAPGGIKYPSPTPNTNSPSGTGTAGLAGASAPTSGVPGQAGGGIIIIFAKKVNSLNAYSEGFSATGIGAPGAAGGNGRGGGGGAAFCPAPFQPSFTQNAGPTGAGGQSWLNPGILNGGSFPHGNGGSVPGPSSSGSEAGGSGGAGRVGATGGAVGRGGGGGAGGGILLVVEEMESVNAIESFGGSQIFPTPADPLFEDSGSVGRIKVHFLRTPAAYSSETADGPEEFEDTLPYAYKQSL